MHYKSIQEAKVKWERRCQRVNWDRLIIKFNDQNGCSSDNIDKYINLNFKNKLFFTCKKWDKEKEYITKLKGEYYVIKQPKRYNNIMASYEPFGNSKYIDITEYINSIR